MIRKLQSGGYRLYSRKVDRRPASAPILAPSSRGRRREKHERECSISSGTSARDGLGEHPR
jgi:hypothetical protein